MLPASRRPSYRRDKGLRLAWRTPLEITRHTGCAQSGASLTATFSVTKHNLVHVSETWAEAVPACVTRAKIPGAACRAPSASYENALGSHELLLVHMACKLFRASNNLGHGDVRVRIGL